MATIIRITDKYGGTQFISDYNNKAGYTANREEAKLFTDGKEDIRRFHRQRDSYAYVVRKSKKFTPPLIEILDADNDRVLLDNSDQTSLRRA